MKRFLSPIIALCLSILLFFGLVAGRHETVTAGEPGRLAPRSDDEQRIIDVYKAVNEAVVFITTITLEVDPFDIFLEYTPRQGTGSGIIVNSEKGIILTNLHVIGNADKIEITLADGQNYKARLLGFDKESDIAVLALIKPPPKLQAAELGDSSRLEVGQRVLAIGNPFGLNRTLTTGIVSSTDRAVKNPNGSLMKGLIQTDAAINPGNSGGPLLDMAGRLIGINTAILSSSGDSAGIGFAVPANQVKRILPELIATGKVLRPKLGWVLVDTNQGPMVLRAIEGGPAAEAGVEAIERRVHDVFLRGYVRDISRADLIWKVNGTRVKSSDEVEDMISTISGSGPITLTLRRGGADGAERNVKVNPVLQ